MEHTPKEEEILADWKKRGDQVSPMDRGLSWDEIADYWLKIRRETIAEEKERVNRFVNELPRVNFGAVLEENRGEYIKLSDFLSHFTQE